MTPIIAIMGIPGAGKSTTLSLLTKRLEKLGIRVALVGREGQVVPPTFAEEISGLDILSIRRNYLCLSICVHYCREAERLSASGQYDMVLMERSWYDALAEADILGAGEDLARLGKKLHRKKPDLVIFLRSSLEEARNRKRKSGSRARVLEIPSLIQPMLVLYEQWICQYHWSSIDVDGLSTDVVTDICLEIIIGAFPPIPSGSRRTRRCRVSTLVRGVGA